jgi:hypothetical protein
MPKKRKKAPLGAARQRKKPPLGEAPKELYVWHLPNEKPGTLIEIFQAEDSRRQNLILDILDELKKADAFRKCSDVIGALVDPYDLILALVIGIDCHLSPRPRLSLRLRLQRNAECARAAACALENLSLSIDECGREGWNLRTELWILADPTERKTIESLRKVAAGIDHMLKRDEWISKGGRPRLKVFRRLIIELAGTFERATGRKATVTRTAYKNEGYSGHFLEFVNILYPIVVGVIEISGVGPFEQSADPGKFIEDTLRERRKTRARAS